jgi:hypothetical protein
MGRRGPGALPQAGKREQYARLIGQGFSSLGEDGFAAGKELTALDEHQVRGWTSWHRWTILALLAHAFLSVLVASQPSDGRPHDAQLIPLTRNEIRRLFTGLRQQLPAPANQLHWSRWRRHHQATARACHYRQRVIAPT